MADRFSHLKVSRRAMLGMVSGSAVCANMKAMAATPNDLKPITGGMQPIGAEERGKRLAKLQRLLQQQHIAGFLVEAGSSLEYFTGIRWWRSERTTAALIPAEVRSIVVTPFFEEPSVREHLRPSRHSTPDGPRHRSGRSQPYLVRSDSTPLARSMEGGGTARS